ncbi:MULTISPECIES: phosphopantetheine-binding protein [unclassified Kitasatospora]|uniref:phosphopantetheine-binding protein n=1 Tax=unclassified Kitasatospora TaxID=2633591 RepID=UPI0009E69D03|nr:MULTISPECIES: phosphopantetheine-binding protein [unclassified Kitasatospora]
MSVDTTTSADSGGTPGNPGSDVESVVAIFRRVLESTEVTPDSDFFLLGGDSLIATRVLSAIARSHGVELSFDDFVLAPTPQGLAEQIATAR